MVNTKLYNLHEDIAHLINESELPSVSVYFMLKDIMRDLEQNAYHALEVEKGEENE